MALTGPPVDAYCAIAHVEALIQQPATLSTTTVPTLAQTETQVTMHFHRINAMLLRTGYHIPVVITGAQLTVSGTLQTRDAHLVNEETIRLGVASGGTLDGALQIGDLLLVSGDSQYYAVIRRSLVETALDQVDAAITPPLRAAIAAATAVTITSNDMAEQMLRDLNAHMTAAWVERRYASMAGGEPGENAKSLQEYADALSKEIKAGSLPIPTAARDARTTPPGAVRLIRRA